MSEAQVLYSKEGLVAVITLNRPEARNAFSTDMIGQWEEYLKQARGDDNVGVIVATGSGDTFCSGGYQRDAEGRVISWTMKTFVWDGVHRTLLPWGTSTSRSLRQSTARPWGQ